MGAIPALDPGSGDNVEGAPVCTIVEVHLDGPNPTITMRNPWGPPTSPDSSSMDGDIALTAAQWNNDFINVDWASNPH